MSKKTLKCFWIYYFTVLTIVVLLNMVACDTPEKTVPNLANTKDPYVSGKPLTIRIFLYDTRAEMQKAYDKLPKADNKELNGFSIQRYNKLYDNKYTSCDIHVVASLVDPDPKQWVWGHELKHCVYGAFHAE